MANNKENEGNENIFKCIPVGCNKSYSTMPSQSNHMKKCEKSPNKKAKTGRE